MIFAARGPAALWNTWSDYPRNRTIHELFEEQVQLRPQAVALELGERKLTYRELDEQANRAACALRELGIGPDVLVGVNLERSVELIVALLGILKAGGAYVPFDTNYPQERLEFMLADSHAPVVVTNACTQERLFSGAGGVRVVAIEEMLRSDETAPRNVRFSSPRNLAYVMYTSGSTGKPKGVQVEHRSVVRLVKETNYCNFGAEEAFLQLAPVSFDASTLEIWGALLNGGRLVIMPAGTPSLEELGRTIREAGVTTVWLTAGLFHLMVDQRLQDLGSLKQLLAGGDVLSAPHVRKVLESAPTCTLINGYGPTENTTFTCCHVMRTGDSVPDSVPIGKPVSNTQVYILNEKLQPVGDGETGELCIGGDGLARGYLNAPELTTDKFIRNPFAEEANSRLYRSGDLARVRKDGTVEFLGRMDQQVKINGYRIEPGEIETVLQQHPAVQQVAVVAQAETAGEKRLVAYVMPSSRGKVDSSELRDHLQKKLPGYMVPATFVMVQKFPLSPNGKVDRAALPAPQAGSPDASLEKQPLDGLEQVVAGIWRKILGNPNVGLDDNFFDLGGDSLSLMEAHAQLQKTVPNFDLSVVDLFEYVTIRTLVQHLGGNGSSNEAALSEAEERARKQREALAAQKQRRAEQYQ